MAGRNGHPGVPADEGIFLTVGVPRGPRAKTHAKRAVEVLRRHGYRAAITSDEAILAGAELLKQHHQDERTDQ